MSFLIIFLIASHPNYRKLEPLLSEGWILGRKVDNSDQQYAGFRTNFPYLLALLLLHPFLRVVYEYLRPIRHLYDEAPSSPPPGESQFSNQAAEARKSRRVSFDLCFACIYVVALHGSSALKILAILSTNYFLASRLKREAIPAATWIFNIGILFANELCRGYRYAAFAEMLSPITYSTAEPNKINAIENWGQYLDSFGGIVPRWEVLFNFTVLRLISFNLDYYWSTEPANTSRLEVRALMLELLDRRLMTSRRSSWILPTSQKGIESVFLLQLETTPSQTISPTICMLLCI